MGASVARVNDIGVGTCSCHKVPIGTSGIIIQGSSNVKANGLSVSRIGDIMLGFCGHIGIIVGGSSTVTATGPKVSRLGDNFSGCFTGVIVGGSPNVRCG